MSREEEAEKELRQLEGVEKEVEEWLMGSGDTVETSDSKQQTLKGSGHLQTSHMETN